MDSDIKVALLGCGNWGKNLLRTFSNLGVLAAIVDANPEQVKKYAKEYDVKALRFEEVLASPDIQAIVIALPAEQHAQAALRAIEAGKHVFIEKPLALLVEDGEKIRDLAREKNVIVMVGHLLQYHPGFIQLKKLVEEGALGTIKSVESRRLNFGRFRKEEDALWSLAPHDISMVLSLFEGFPETINLYKESVNMPAHADSVHVQLGFSTGHAHIHVSWLHPTKVRQFTVIGDKAMAVFDDGDVKAPKLTLYPYDFSHKEGGVLKAMAPQEIPIPKDEPLITECVHFISCCANQNTPLTDVDEALRVLRVLSNTHE
ncbi:MAG: oxidoreductase [Robiginitomaculum sp.]|nr:MAG: oxidoreductase [Robiginitomaculum sp.]